MKKYILMLAILSLTACASNPQHGADGDRDCKSSLNHAGSHGKNGGILGNGGNGGDGHCGADGGHGGHGGAHGGAGGNGGDSYK